MNMMCSRCLWTRRSSLACLQLLLPTSSKRCFASSRGDSGSRRRYIDQWHAETVKKQSFYEKLSSGPEKKRKCYFYSVDLQGRLFLEEVLPKNIATSLKDTTFLDFFFRRIRRVGPKERSILAEHSVEDDYPFVSPCGVELNFIRPADTAIVFHELRNRTDSPGGNTRELVFGGTLCQPFQPDKLAISKRTGRLYHEITARGSGSKTPRLVEPSTIEYGLVKSSVAVALSEGIVDGDKGTGLSTLGSEYTGFEFQCFDSGERHPIAWLPDGAEAGPWGLPFVEDDEE